jgi:hypothetical protein
MQGRPLLALWLCAATAFAQNLPPSSRTVYKCEEGGKVHYSDSPCLGATKLDVVPTRGLNKTSGQERKGRDVQHELHRDAVAAAIQPLTGMDAQQLDQLGRRQRLSREAQRQCAVLDKQLPIAEAAEMKARGGDERKAAQKHLLELRTTYRQLRCD